MFIAAAWALGIAPGSMYCPIPAVLAIGGACGVG